MCYNLNRNLGGCMKKLFKNKFVIIILCICLLTTIGVGVNLVGVLTKTQGSGENIGSSTGGLKDNGVYSIPTNPTQYQKDLYNELTKALEGYVYSERSESEQSKEICQLVVKNFIADFFTWTNKSSTYDIGGQQFMWSDLYLVMEQVARESFYKDLDGYVEQYGRDNLMEVDSIETNIAFTNGYNFDEKVYDAYYAEAKWTYKPNASLDIEQFQQSAGFFVVWHEETGRWEIAQIWD